MDVSSVEKVRFADDPMQTESSSAKSRSSADEATSSSGHDVDMTSPVASPSSMARPTAVIPLQPGSPSAPSQGIRHLPPIPRAPQRALNTIPIPPVLASDLPPLPEVPRWQAAVAQPPAVLVMELNQLSIEPMSTTAKVPSPQPIQSLPLRAQVPPLAESPMVPMAPSTQPGPSTESPSIPPTQLRPSRSMGPMAREDIQGRRDEVMEALDFPDAVQDMARELWSNNCDAEEAFPVDITVEFRRAICHAASAGDMSSVDLDFGRYGERGPVAPIDPHHDAPLVEGFTKYYDQWVQLHLRRRRELLAELMLLHQMEGLDDLIKHTEGLDAEWMRDQ
ncbi:hypothetical protein PAXRUDRAFT_21712 [Paxillus rubicundulus Ve08.2h10]|uniref:Uncharacterized protein n=1 Tax=Paxillus rubicundulus Ve08.2h10 TaxID=930991 RepID=A0A0D0CYW6_9AGAM|nr:hypothetical protein PAXRUDRAFT_21712 [Paxillus rubicundulus Ve08.2h10]